MIGAGGGVGHMGVQFAKAMGLRVIGVDSGEDKKRQGQMNEQVLLAHVTKKSFIIEPSSFFFFVLFFFPSVL